MVEPRTGDIGPLHLSLPVKTRQEPLEHKGLSRSLPFTANHPLSADGPPFGRQNGRQE